MPAPGIDPGTGRWLAGLYVRDTGYCIDDVLATARDGVPEDEARELGEERAAALLEHCRGWVERRKGICSCPDPDCPGKWPGTPRSSWRCGEVGPVNIWIAVELEGVETVTTIRRKFPCVLPVGSKIYIDNSEDLYRLEVSEIEWWDADQEVILSLVWEDQDTAPTQSMIPAWIKAGWEEW